MKKAALAERREKSRVSDSGGDQLETPEAALNQIHDDAADQGQE